MAPRQQIVSMDKTGGRRAGDFRPRRMGDPELEPLPAVAAAAPRRMGDPVEDVEAPKGSPAPVSAESLPDGPKVRPRMGVDAGEQLVRSDSSSSVTPPPNPPVPSALPTAPPSPLVPESDANAAKAVPTPAKTGSLPSLPNQNPGNPTPPA